MRGQVSVSRVLACNVLSVPQKTTQSVINTVSEQYIDILLIHTVYF